MTAACSSARRVSTSPFPSVQGAGSAGDAEALAAAIGRFFADERLREQLRAAAAPSVARYGAEPIYARLEQALADAAANRTRN